MSRPPSWTSYPGNGTTRQFSVPFPYLLRTHVQVGYGWDANDNTFTQQLSDPSGFRWISGTTIELTTAPASGQSLFICRKTPSDEQLVQWVDGSTITAYDINTADLQILYVIQELEDATAQQVQAGVSDPVFIQPTPPTQTQLAGASRFAWFDTSNNKLTLWIEDGL